ncbi:PadR family transcriptional regulator [Allostreptomyces psammosilenae]|uniref:DNA-binding PadR family transcriptional regulator n=1 Tax=Allostreptomyces psammosilenae TaxID=1892865 RepID=A0A853A621_9ACTN|nr:PadR family transcriptional regulator [Allostreptomyces psammosilenae]NYI08294.1 DNA-binding PadR family transcriptional regulator [Allostreptomyces psammosilenae]
MSIKYGLLALLEGGPRYGYQLRAEFESRTGGTWPLNIGQVYTTLARAERDGLVENVGTEDGNQVYYAITAKGREELRVWFASPVDRAGPPRNELAIKLAMAVGSPGVDVSQVIQTQRHHTIRALQDLTRLKAQRLAAPPRATDRDDVAWTLVLEQLIYQTEAEVRWLDHCETQLGRIARSVPASPAPATAPDTPAGGTPRPDQGGPEEGERDDGAPPLAAAHGPERRRGRRRH